MASIEIILDKVRAMDLSKRTRGSIFERLSTHLLKEQDSANEYKSITLWNEWEHKDGSDIGTDIVIETKNGEFIAAQCKHYNSRNISLNDVNNFFSQLQSGVGDIVFSRGILAITADLSKNVKRQIDQINRSKPIDLITIQDFRNSNIDWEKLDPTKSKDIPTLDKKKPFKHQKEALDAIESYFNEKNADGTPKNTRGKLIMACGTGKTFTSLKALEMLTDAKDSITLFLAPSIALLGQTLREYIHQKNDNFTACVVCSDASAARGEDDINPSELPITPSTNVKSILKSYKKAKEDKVRFIIFSTYQSIERINEAQNFKGDDEFTKDNKLPQIDLIICDEAHRSVGAIYENNTNTKTDQNIFTLCHDNAHINAKRRIYMTATPKIYSEKQKAKATSNEGIVFSMDDEKIFGDTIYEIRFDKAVEKGLLSDYKVIILAVKKETYSHIANNAIAKLKENKENNLNEKNVDLEFVCKIIGTHKGLAKSDLFTLDSNGILDEEYQTNSDLQPSQRAINFCRNIATSKNIKNSFQVIMDCYDEEMKIQSHKINIDHVDGTMGANERLKKLDILDNWHDDEEKSRENTCALITNARCLSEGIDVPTLDSVVFFDGRSAMVDIIQAVGRVMRKAPNKKLGYVILPIALSEEELKDINKAVNDTNFKNIWNVLKALRSHDESFVSEAVFKNKIKLAIADNTSNEVNPTRQTAAQKRKDEKQRQQENKEHIQNYLFTIQSSLNDISNALFNVLPTKLGDKYYWASFSNKTGKIVENLNKRLNAYFDSKPEILSEFITSLKEAIHPNISDDEGVDMLASHIVTSPIFDSIFGEEIGKNPIGMALDGAFSRLKELGLEDEELQGLGTLYESIKESADRAKTQKEKQTLIKDLYDTFFKAAFKKQSERLGIVYTPIEVIDFMLHSTNELLKKYFNESFDSNNVKIFDAFTGTGAFIARLLGKDNGLIQSQNLRDRYLNGIYAQDINLLAYYIALINISQVAQNRVPNLPLFANIALADSLNYMEDANDTKEHTLFQKCDKDLKENKNTQDTIKNAPIQVLIGNPPYSSGQGSSNDNNANYPHPKLEARLREKYGSLSADKRQSGKPNRDTIIQAIRMASDRVLNQGWGVVSFVVNGGFIDGKSADGLRKALISEFDEIYVLNLRGKKSSKKVPEGENVFESIYSVGVALIFLVKKKTGGARGLGRDEKGLTKKAEGILHYYEVPDYWDRNTKLSLLRENKDIFASGWEGASEIMKRSLERIYFKHLTPNKHGDWINQRDESFYDLLPMKSQIKNASKNKNENAESKTIFIANSNGLASRRNEWVYNFDKGIIEDSMKRCIATYREDAARFDRAAFLAQHSGVKKDELYKKLTDREITTDESKISWSDNVKKKFVKNEKIEDFLEAKIRTGHYRPFIKMNIYFDKTWNERQSQLHSIFPAPDSKNVVMCLAGDVAQPAIMVRDDLVDRSLNTHTILYPLYFYEKAEGNKLIKDGEEVFTDSGGVDNLAGGLRGVSNNLGGVRGCGREIKYEKKSAISPWALNIFRKHYADEKITPEDIFYYAFAIYNHRGFLGRFKNSLAKASARLPLSPDFKKLVKLGKKLAHLQINYESGEKFNPKNADLFLENKDDSYFYMTKMIKNNDGSKIVYNKNITIDGIPERAYHFKINGKSAIDWIINFYSLTQKEAPNNKAKIENDPNKFNNSKYIYDLLLRIIALSINCEDIIDDISECKF